MKITSIKAQIKSKDKLSVFIDNRFAFSLPNLEISNLGLQAGMELTPQDVKKLKQRSSVNQAKIKVLKLLSFRARSEKEVLDYLKRNNYNPDTIEEAINYFKEVGLVNDSDFARQWLKNRSEFKRNSFKQTRAELIKKGISRDIINEVLEENPIDELEIIREVVEKKRHQSRYQDDFKLMQYLARKGYNYDKIKRALE
jgi:regulatory protein